MAPLRRSFREEIHIAAQIWLVGFAASCYSEAYDFLSHLFFKAGCGFPLDRLDLSMPGCWRLTGARRVRRRPVCTFCGTAIFE